jgi:hypothetical protein
MKHIVILALGLAMSAASVAQGGFWRDREGNPAPETQARRSLNGLGGWLLVTSDANWREKWHTPSTSVPSFNEAKTLARGEKAFILVFFANPKLTPEGRADLTCDLEVTRPDGASAVHQTDVVCFRGTIKASPYNMYLSAPVLGFVSDASDPVGSWIVQVSLKDNLRNTVLPLKASFTLK